MLSDAARRATSSFCVRWRSSGARWINGSGYFDPGGKASHEGHRPDWSYTDSLGS